MRGWYSGILLFLLQMFQESAFILEGSKSSRRPHLDTRNLVPVLQQLCGMEGAMLVSGARKKVIEGP